MLNGTLRYLLVGLMFLPSMAYAEESKDKADLAAGIFLDTCFNLASHPEQIREWASGHMVRQDKTLEQKILKENKGAVWATPWANKNLSGLLLVLYEEPVRCMVWAEQVDTHRFQENFEHIVEISKEKIGAELAVDANWSDGIWGNYHQLIYALNPEQKSPGNGARLLLEISTDKKPKYIARMGIMPPLSKTTDNQ